MNVIKYNQQSWDSLVENGDKWTTPVEKQIIAEARAGNWSVVLTPIKAVPDAWFPDDIHGKSVLCLASGGGQQGPVLAAAGAKVTVFDNSVKQLEQDNKIAQREGLTITTIQGDMKDLSCFKDQSFDLIFHPVANCFVDTVLPVWKEAYRVLKAGGSLLSGFANPIMYVFDYKAWDEGRLEARHSIPYADISNLTAEELDTLIISEGDPLCFGHSLQDQIQGQLEVGFVMAGFYEDKSGGGPLDKYIDSYMATKCIKLS